MCAPRRSTVCVYHCVYREKTRFNDRAFSSPRENSEDGIGALNKYPVPKTSVAAEQSAFLIRGWIFIKNLRFCRAPLETTRLSFQNKKIERWPREF